MDWASVAPAAITGVVGLAGIGGALWEGKRAREEGSNALQASLEAGAKNLDRSVTAEDRRAYLAEKRRVYAAFNAAIESLWFIVTSSQDFTADPGRSNYNQAMTALWSAYYEVSLTAPRDIEKSARGLTDTMTDFAAARRQNRKANEPSGYDEDRKDLIDAMRTNLGADE